jgi:hypothetical protein
MPTEVPRPLGIYLITQDLGHLYGWYLTNAVVIAWDAEEAVAVLFARLWKTGWKLDGDEEVRPIVQRSRLSVKKIGTALLGTKAAAVCVATGEDNDKAPSPSDLDAEEDPDGEED